MLTAPDTLTRRTAFLVFFLAAMPNMTGCASRVETVYRGPERPPSEIATIYNSPRAFTSSIVSVISTDDQRVKATAAGYTVLPGAHWYQVWVDRLSTVSFFILHDVYNTEAVCGFRLDTAPGSVYQLVDVDNGVVIPVKEAGMYKAIVRLQRQFAGSAPQVVDVPADCASITLFAQSRSDIPHDLARGGLLCRSRDDCMKDGADCVIGRDYTYGICAQP